MDCGWYWEDWSYTLIAYSDNNPNDYNNQSKAAGLQSYAQVREMDDTAFKLDTIGVLHLLGHE